MTGIVVLLICVSIAIVAAIIYAIQPTHEVAGAAGLERFGPVTYIRLRKTTVDPSEETIAVQNNTFQIGELIIRTAQDRILTRDDIKEIKFNGVLSEHYAQYFSPWNLVDGDNKIFASTEGPAELHEYVIVLNRPTVLRSITVENRHDCCQGRLDGTVLELLNEQGTALLWLMLTAEQTQLIE